MDPSLLLPRAWRAALSAFVVAALTGLLYRTGLTYGVTLGFDLVHIRHAHSHLMYFGWATPALFALMAAALPRLTGRPAPRGLAGVLTACFGAALVAYPLFLLFGYTPVAVGPARMPLAVIGSTLNMFGWWGFTLLYARWTRGVERGPALLLWDLALTMLVLATLGAGGLALLKPLGIEDPTWASALTHIFLDLFSEGWFVLAVLGLAHAVLRPAPSRWTAWSLYALGAGVPVLFALGMPSALVPPGLKLLARAGGTLVGLGLLAQTAVLARAALGRGAGLRWRWLVPLAFLAMKAAGQLGISLAPGAWWSGLPGLRILYLHLMLLGFVTLGAAAAARAAWGPAAGRGHALFYAAVTAVLLTLVPLSSLWPAPWGGRWTFVLATWTAAAPILAALVLLATSRRPRRADASRLAPILTPEPTP